MAKNKKKETEVLEIEDKELEKKLFEEIDEVEVLDEDVKYYEDEEPEYYEKKKKEKKPRNYNKILTTILLIAMAITIMISTDVICVSRFNVGPFFALPLHTYKDGGSRAYYGIGYKVIQYNQIQGRRDKELGFWNLKYNTNAINIKDLDLAIDFYKNKNKAYNKYYKKFVRVDTSLLEVDDKNKVLLLGYKDGEGDKYNININCNMANTYLDHFTPGNEIMIIGTFSKYNPKTNTITIDNCFAEQ